MARPELGIKRQCMNCGAKFYDLARDPAVCPKCGTVYQIATGRTPPALARKNEEETEEDEARPDVVSLDEVEASEEEADTTSDDDEAGEAAGGTEDDTFLEEEDGDDDVSDLIDNEGDGDEEG